MHGTWTRSAAAWSTTTAKRSPFTGTDFALLKLFLDHPQQVLDRDTIGDTLLGRKPCCAQERGVDTAVYRLRRRLRDNAKPPRLILTVRGGGYLLAAEGDLAQPGLSVRLFRLLVALP